MSMMLPRSTGRDLRLVRLGLIAGHLCGCFALVEGCAQAGGRATPTLQGHWRPVGPALGVLMSSEGVRTETGTPTMWQAGLMIQADGSFDLPILLYDEFEDGYERLRASGDRVYIGSVPDESAVFMQVESCAYSPTSSEVVVGEHYKDPTENVTYLFSARLIPGDRLLFVCGVHGPGPRSAVYTAVLERMGAKAARDFDAMTGRAQREAAHR